MQYLRGDTSGIILAGPAVDKGDAVTPVAGLTVGAVDEVVIYKHDATSATDISGTTTMIHRAGGLYTLTLSTTDTNTTGRMTLFVRDDSECLPFWKDFTVISPPVYDALFAASGVGILPVDVVQASGSPIQQTEGIMHAYDEDGTSITDAMTTLHSTTDAALAAHDALVSGYVSAISGLHSTTDAALAVHDDLISGYISAISGAMTTLHTTTDAALAVHYDLISGYVSAISGYVDFISGIVVHADYGNAQLLRSTTPANTLDVDASNRAAAKVEVVDDDAITLSSAADTFIEAISRYGYVDRSITKAAAAVATQNITSGMAVSGCIQYETINVSKTRNWGSPDITYYLLWHYDANGDVDEVKPDTNTTW